MLSMCTDCKNLAPGDTICGVNPQYRLAVCGILDEVGLVAQRKAIEALMPPCPDYSDSPEMRAIEAGSAVVLSLRGWKVLLDASRASRDLLPLVEVCESVLKSQGEPIDFDPIPF